MAAKKGKKTFKVRDVLYGKKKKFQPDNEFTSEEEIDLDD